MNTYLKNVAFIWPNYGPHHLARMAVLSHYEPKISAIEISKRQVIYPWYSDRDNLLFSLTTLFEKPYEKLSSNEISKRTIIELKNIRPDIIIIPGLTATHYRAIARWAKANKIKIIISMSSWAGIKKRGFIKEYFKSMLYRRYSDGMVCTGILSKLYANSMGFDDSKLWISGNALLNIHYDKAIRHASELNKNKIAGLNENFFIYVGRFSPEKNLPRLIQAFEDYRIRGGEWELMLVGDGVDANKVNLSIASSKYADKIQIIKWASPDELIKLYSTASCLVLPSTMETWGLVVQEAMLRGLPILLSNRCGCMPEFCVKGVNGYNFDPFKTKQITHAMIQVSTSEEMATKMGMESIQIAKRYSLNMWAQAYADCIKYFLHF